MRRRNPRLIWTGAALAVLAAAFFVGMQVVGAPHSNDPVTMMRTVGQVSGVLVALGVGMIIIGLIGKKA